MSDCERAREWISLELDDELSQHELAQLRAHLAVCAACVPYARAMHVVTEELRATDPVRPTAAVRLPRRRSGVALRAATGLVAIAATVGLAAVGGSLPSTAPSSPSAHGSSAHPPYFERQLLRLARRAHGGSVDV